MNTPHRKVVTELPHKIDEALTSLYGDGHSRDTIIYCDDEPCIAKLMTEVLSLLFNKNVLAYPSAVHALKAISIKESLRSKIALIVSDYDMPEKTGFSFANELRRNPELKDVPFLLTSGNVGLAQNCQLLESLETGSIDGFMPKPTRMSEIPDVTISAINVRIKKLTTIN
ncbi:MAG TPA: response regulator [Flavobacteriales bacterium]|nr:response regulator [Flavobacteriales bacterium]